MHLRQWREGIRSRKGAGAGAALAMALLGGCASNYVYTPQEEATAQAAGLPAARYQLPPERPQGDVRVAALGVTKLKTAEETYYPSVHVRMDVANNGGQTPWAFDTREVFIDVPGAGRSSPIYVKSGSRDPVVMIAPGQKRTVDLYFPLPQQASTGRKLKGFDVGWQVATSTRVVAERTPFAREYLDYGPYYDGPYGYGYTYGLGWGPAWGWGPGWGPYWAMDPFYAGGGLGYPPPYNYPPAQPRVTVPEPGGQIYIANPDSPSSTTR